MEKLKEFLKDKVATFTLVSLICFLLFSVQTCSISRKIKNVSELQVKIDSLSTRIKSLESSQVSKKEYKEISERTMYQFLIFEEDVDKGKISLSEIELKLKNEK